MGRRRAELQDKRRVREGGGVEVAMMARGMVNRTVGHEFREAGLSMKMKCGTKAQSNSFISSNNFASCTLPLTQARHP